MQAAQIPNQGQVQGVGIEEIKPSSHLHRRSVVLGASAALAITLVGLACTGATDDADSTSDQSGRAAYIAIVSGGPGTPATVEPPQLLRLAEAYAEARQRVGFEFLMPSKYPGGLQVAEVVVRVNQNPVLAGNDFARRSVAASFAKNPTFSEVPTGGSLLVNRQSVVLTLEVQNPTSSFAAEQGPEDLLIEVDSSSIGQVWISRENGRDLAYSWLIGETVYFLQYPEPGNAGSIPRDDVLAMIESMADP